MSEHADSSDLFFDTPQTGEPPIDIAAVEPEPRPPASEPAPADSEEAVGPWKRMGREILAALQTLVSAAVYATLIVTFGVQVARVDGLSMAPTLEDHDRLIVNKLVYELGEPRPGDIVMLYYPLNPDKMFVKRVIAREGDTVRLTTRGRMVADSIGAEIMAAFEPSLETV